MDFRSSILLLIDKMYWAASVESGFLTRMSIQSCRVLLKAAIILSICLLVIVLAFPHQQDKHSTIKRVAQAFVCAPLKGGDP